MGINIRVIVISRIRARVRRIWNRGDGLPLLDTLVETFALILLQSYPPLTRLTRRDTIVCNTVITITAMPKKTAAAEA